ncbi:hypothetical protein Syun_006029 [Stephania yunnanensis]|uniref:CHHC U11-48K-type domain-containing protein n=1 Tax=Stephania yunnanensis TaxID=152371 RepID=A0AAP0KVV2_9MAGN
MAFNSCNGFIRGGLHPRDQGRELFLLRAISCSLAAGLGEKGFFSPFFWWVLNGFFSLPFRSLGDELVLKSTRLSAAAIAPGGGTRIPSHNPAPIPSPHHPSLPPQPLPRLSLLLVRHPLTQVARCSGRHRLRTPAIRVVAMISTGQGLVGTCLSVPRHVAVLAGAPLSPTGSKGGRRHGPCMGRALALRPRHARGSLLTCQDVPSVCLLVPRCAKALCQGVPRHCAKACQGVAPRRNPFSPTHHFTCSPMTAPDGTNQALMARPLLVDVHKIQNTMKCRGVGDYPREYSFSVLRVALCLPMIREYDSVEWMISNSPHFGVVIDVAMSEHVYLLLKLCLKAVSYEARRSSKLYDGGVGDVKFGSIRFACPVLIDVMTWFATQLSVLYGEANAKLFSIEMLKHFMLNAASRLMMFPSDEKEKLVSASTVGCGYLDDSSNGTIGELVGAIESKNVKIEEPTVGSGKENLLGIENKRSDLVYVSQVAAAVAALHERSVLEEKIKGQRLAGSVPKTQLISEHAYVTKKADEERKKRPNYRPILEYDGLLSHRSHNEDSRKMKTKEELLAEERDYKRRRMSYRGKKLKRSITEVMRDIIEEHMEEIKQAGGIGCFVKGSSEGVSFPSGSVSDREMAADDKPRNLGFDSSETREMQMGHYHRSLSSNNSFASIENVNLKDSRRREYSGRHESLDVQPRSIRKASERDREYRSRSPDNYRNHGHSHDRHGHQRERDKKKVTEYKYDENRRSRESRSSSISDLASDFSHRKNREMPRSEGRHRDRTFGTHRSDNMSPSSFDDRYDPSESYNRYDEDVSSSSKYARTDKSYKSK